MNNLKSLLAVATVTAGVMAMGSNAHALRMGDDNRYCASIKSAEMVVLNDIGVAKAAGKSILATSPLSVKHLQFKRLFDEVCY